MSNEKIAQSIADMVTEWVEGGIRVDTDWRNGLPSIIQKRLDRFEVSTLKPTVDESALSTLRDILEEARGYIRMTSDFKAKDVEWRMVRRIDYALYATGDWKIYPVTAEVPIDPTAEMIKAAMAVDLGNEDEEGAIVNVWHAMVAAARDNNFA